MILLVYEGEDDEDDDDDADDDASLSHTVVATHCLVVKNYTSSCILLRARLSRNCYRAYFPHLGFPGFPTTHS